MARSRKLNFKSILKVVAFAALAILLIGGISSCFGDDTDTVSMFEFERGELDKDGKHVESKRAVYTKTAFECIGLEIVPEFDAHVSYDVYYYDADDNFLDAVTGFTKKYSYDHPFATHARVVIYPDVPEDESEEDYEIPFYEVYSVANKLSISVSKKQTSKYTASQNMYDEQHVTYGKASNTSEEGILELIENTSAKVSESIVPDSAYDYYDIFIKAPGSNYDDVTISCVVVEYIKPAFVTLEVPTVVKECKSSANLDSWIKITLDISDVESVDYFRISLPNSAQCYVFKTKTNTSR